MKSSGLYLAIFSFVMLTCACEKVIRDEPLVEDLSRLLEEQFSSYSNSFTNDIGVALVIRDAQGVEFGQFGFDKPYTVNTLHRAASTTKTFTGAAIMKLYQEGKLDIDDVITNLIPGMDEPYIPDEESYDIPHKNAITIRKLLQHRAGVFDLSNQAVPDSVDAVYAGAFYFDYIKEMKGSNYSFTKEELVAPVAKHKLSYFAPGTGFHYSNTGFVLLGIIVERVSGLSLNEYLQESFLAPLDLDQTRFAITGVDAPEAPTMDNYLLIDGTESPSGFDNLSSAQAEGNIITSLNDLSVWAYRLYGTSEILDSEMVNQMTNVTETGDWVGNYGLATTAFPLELGVGHDGAHQGFMTIMRYHAPTKSAYVAVTNMLDVDDFGSQVATMLGVIEAGISYRESKQ
ncbi:MAG: beta-lactamase family protein [Saprospiraceae bacterium]|nr:beta-lactamase family protein [Saprospiraceae bacterium]